MAFNLTSNEVKGPLRWWYKLGAPRNVTADAPLKARERVRIGKIISLALFIELIEIGMAAFSMTEDPNKLLVFAYLGMVGTLLIALLLNKWGKVWIAGILVVGMIEAAMVLTIFGVPHQQLDTFNLPLFALFIQPLLIAASIFPIWLVFPLSLYHIAFTCLAITFMAKTPDLMEHIQLMPYTVYSIPITLQVITALVSFVWVSSAKAEMRRAETAEEVNRLTQQIANQLTESAERQEELERNIEAIRNTLNNVASGNYQQQVPLSSDDLLWPIARTLNTLLGRVRAFREQSTQFEQVNKKLYELTGELYHQRTGQKAGQTPLNDVRATFDLLAAELRIWLPLLSARIPQQPFPSTPGNYPSLTPSAPLSQPGIPDAGMAARLPYRRFKPPSS
jgi:hypothetical protein